MVSGTLSYCSLLTVENSLKNMREILRSRQDIWVMKINGILKEISYLKKIYIKTFQGIEKFRGKIIFNGKLK